jgi:inosose dehydratase
MTRPVVLGSAPDSWGVWYADDPQQTPWERFLDEVAAAGYTRIELGPYGYLPTEPSRLREELDRRGLEMTAGTIFEHLHRADSWDSTWEGVSAAASLTAAMGARHLVVIPDFWRDPATGALVEEPQLTDEQWAPYARNIDRLARQVREEFGLRLQFHPHADSHVDTHANVERFLEATDPALVSLCLDTGHIAYCGGDNLRLIEDHPSRIGYVHLKQVDPAVVDKVHAEGLGFGEAVRLGAMCEPPLGVPDLPPILDALSNLDGLDAEIFAIVEQDMYPCPADQPFPIAKRTHDYLTTCGGGRLV